MTDFKGRDIISSRDFSVQDLQLILDTADKFWPLAAKDEKARAQMGSLLEGKVLATLFYEPSTRTRFSFETAMIRLGGKVISVTGMENSSLTKGETLWDTGKVVENFADVIAMRHPQPGSSKELADAASVPVLNGGDGPHEHPTQALLDLFTLRKELGRLENLTIAFVGDLKFSRVVHSLSILLSNFKVNFMLVSPPELKTPQEFLDLYKAKNIQFRETEKIEEAVASADMIYMTRIQQERFEDPAEYEKFRGGYILDRALLQKFGGKDWDKKLIMQPLPRLWEVPRDVDDLPGAAYFRQVQNGVAVRMALLALVLGKS